MALFRHNRCAAFDWDQDNNYYGVLCDRAGSATRVRKHWQAQKTTSQSPAEILAAGRRELGYDDDTIVIVGGNFRKACFVDLEIPRIAAENMRGALQFELSKYSPINIDELEWSYRNVLKHHGTEKQTTRIVYFRREDWERWIEAASGLERGVDMVIPASAVLDPMLDTVDVALSEGVNGDYFVFKHGANGQRQIAYTNSPPTGGGIVGTGKTPLDQDWLVPGPLTTLPADNQVQFMPSLLLSRYGMSDQFRGDHKQWLRVPVEMRPRRNRVVKTLTMIAVAYLVFILSVLACFWVYDHHQELEQARHRTKELKMALYELEQKAELPEIATSLQEELDERGDPRVRLTEALSEITDVVTDNLWSTNFGWNAGNVTLQLQTDAYDEQMTDGLQQCIAFEHTNQQHRTDPGGKVKITIDGTVQSLEGYLEAKALRDAQRAAERAQAALEAKKRARLAREQENREKARSIMPPPPPPLPPMNSDGLEMPEFDETQEETENEDVDEEVENIEEYDTEEAEE
jgi:hypothetical protein